MSDSKLPVPTPPDTRKLERRIKFEENPPASRPPPDKPKTALHPRFAAFLDHYCEHHDARLAAIAAGFSPSYAKDASRAILTRPEVWREFKRRERATLLALGVTPSRIMRLVAGAVFTSPADLMRWDNNELVLKSSDDLPPEALAAVKSIEMTESYTKAGEPLRKVKVQMYDRLKAADVLARLMSLHTDEIDPEESTSRKSSFRIGDQVIEFD